MILPFSRSLSVASVDNDNYRTELVAESDRLIMKFDGIQSQEDLKSVETSTPSPGPHGVVAVSTLTSSSKKTNSDEDASTKDDSTENKTGKLVVVGSSHMFSNNGMKMSGANRDFMGSLISYMVRDDNFVSIPLKEFAKGDLNMSSSSSQLLYSLIVYIYPFLFLGVTIFYWLMRKRKTA